MNGGNIMKFGRKTMAVISMISILAVSLAGCGGKNGTTGTSNGLVNLTMWVHETDSPEGKLYKQEVQDFNKANKGKINVKLTAIPRSSDASGYDDKVNAAVTTKSLPDVLTCDGPNVAAEAKNGILAPITNYVSKQELSDYTNDIVNQGTYDGQLYGLGPYDSSVGIIYNKDTFQKAGITAPTDVKHAWTWDEFYENAKKLTDKKNGVYGVDFQINMNSEWRTYALLPLVQSQGKNIISKDGKTVDGYLNSQESVNALTYIKKFVDEGLVSKDPIQNSFEQGKAAMLLSGNWEPGTLKNYPNIKWGLMPYPVAPNGKAVSPCGTWGFYMTTNCSKDKQKAAAKLILYMTSTQSGIKMFKANGMIPSRKSAVSQISELQSLPLKVFADQLKESAVPRPVTPNYPVLSDQFATAINNAVNGMDPKKALDNAVKQVQPELEK